MPFLDVLLVIASATIIGVLFYYVFRIGGPWGRFWAFLLILILAGVSAEAWIPEIGPVYWNVTWVPTLFVIFLFALLLAAATPPAKKIYPKDSPELSTGTPKSRDDIDAAILLSGFFWFFMFFLFIAAIWGLIAAY
jgi:hypothetical protein